MYIFTVNVGIEEAARIAAAEHYSRYIYQLISLLYYFILTNVHLSIYIRVSLDTNEDRADETV